MFVMSNNMCTAHCSSVCKIMLDTEFHDSFYFNTFLMAFIFVLLCFSGCFWSNKFIKSNIMLEECPQCVWISHDLSDRQTQTHRSMRACTLSLPPSPPTSITMFTLSKPQDNYSLSWNTIPNLLSFFGTFTSYAALTKTALSIHLYTCTARIAE
jgi:hypothetical protein